MALYAFDGTWHERGGSDPSNVVLFKNAYRGRSEYISGVGTRFGRIGYFAGGLAGAGGRERIAEATEKLRSNFENGDDVVDIIGFSRGGALALHFSNHVQTLRVRDKEGRTVTPKVRFLGLWDVVGAFGIPINLGLFSFQRINLGWKLKLSPNVQHCFHAAALDERRQTFDITRLDNGYQVWFRGNHSDVGGGNSNPGLSNIALRWMLRKAALVGIDVDRSVADKLECAEDANLVEPGDLIKNALRKLHPKDVWHYTVRPRKDGRCQDPPDQCLRETEEHEANRARMDL
jgi:uncharacterized protein (DUF2235 family)